MRQAPHFCRRPKGNNPPISSSRVSPSPFLGSFLRNQKRETGGGEGKKGGTNDDLFLGAPQWDQTAKGGEENRERVKKQRRSNGGERGAFSSEPYPPIHWRDPTKKIQERPRKNRPMKRMRGIPKQSFFFFFSILRCTFTSLFSLAASRVCRLHGRAKLGQEALAPSTQHRRTRKERK